jgi:hypothetical protein
MVCRKSATLGFTQPPAMAAATPLVANLLLLPNGNSQFAAVTQECVRSKSETARFAENWLGT